MRLENSPRLSDLGDMAYRSRVKAMHHWIRKGNADRAARVSRDLFHQINAMQRVGIGVQDDQGAIDA
jgi:hypothetical protein